MRHLELCSEGGVRICEGCSPKWTSESPKVLARIKSSEYKGLRFQIGGGIGSQWGDGGGGWFEWMRKTEIARKGLFSVC